MSDHWDEPWEVIPIDRKFLYEKRFSEDDRRESLSDEDFLTLLSCRVRCLDAECDSYFVFRPLSSDSGKCWNCGREYVVPEEAHRFEVEDHGPMTVPVLIPGNDEDFVRLVGADGEGWAFIEYMEWIGADWEDFYEYYLGI